MKTIGDALLVTKAEARALLAFAPRDEGVTGIVAQGSQLAAVDGDARSIVLALEDGTAWAAVPYLVPRDAWESAIRACPARGLIAVRRGELAVFRCALDADETADATAEERSARALATLEYEPGEAPFVRVDAGDGSPRAWSNINAAHVAALGLVARACEGIPAVVSAPLGDGPLVVECGAFRCAFAQIMVTGDAS
jgi:hypothetical protein